MGLLIILRNFNIVPRGKRGKTMALTIICIADVRYHQIFEPRLSVFLVTNRDVCDKKKKAISLAR